MGSPPLGNPALSILTGILNRAHWRCAAVRRGAREEAKRRTLNSFRFTQCGDANTKVSAASATVPPLAITQVRSLRPRTIDPEWAEGEKRLQRLPETFEIRPRIGALRK